MCLDEAPRSKVVYYFLKFICGVDRKQKVATLTKEEKYRLLMAATDIHEKPFWKKVMDVNGIICSMCCFFLHGFWA